MEFVLRTSIIKLGENAKNIYYSSSFILFFENASSLSLLSFFFFR